MPDSFPDSLDIGDRHRVARFVLLALLIMPFVGCGGGDGGGGQSPPLRHPSPWKLVWSDEFDAAAGTGVDPHKWLYDIGTGYPGGQPNWEPVRSRS